MKIGALMISFLLVLSFVSAISITGSAVNNNSEEDNQVKNQVSAVEATSQAKGNSETIREKVEAKVENKLNDAQLKKLIKVKNKLRADAKNNQIECPAKCTCTGSAMKCEFANGTREMTITAGNSGNVIVQVKGITASTQVTLYKAEDGKIYAVKKNNETKEIRMLPDQVKERIKNKIKAKLENETMTLAEDGTYDYTAEKKTRLFGIFAIKRIITAKVDAETGELTQTNKPAWWEFLAKDEEAEPIFGESCGVVTPGENNNCCKTKGYDVWDNEASECEFSA